MKQLLGFISLMTLCAFSHVGGIYTIPVKNIDGASFSLGQYTGKKIMFIVLPLSATDTTVSATQLAAMETKYDTSLIVIGVPSEESGFTSASIASLKQLYLSQKANFTLAEGMKVKKGTGQHALFQWLTNKNLNKHFDQDVQGVGSKFFVDERGELYAVMGPGVKLTNPVMDKILTRPSN